MAELEEFLELQSQQGEWDSTGQFSLDLAGQLARLRGHLLSDDTLALVKIVQAFCGWGSSEIHVNLVANELSVHASDLQEIPLDKGESGETGGVLALPDSPLKDFLLGLLHLLQRDPQIAGVSVWKSGHLVSWSSWFGGERPQRIRLPGSIQDGVGLHLQVASAKACYSFDENAFRRRLFYAPCAIHFRGDLIGRQHYPETAMPAVKRLLLEYYAPVDPYGRMMARPLGDATDGNAKELNWPGPTSDGPDFARRRFFGADTSNPIVHRHARQTLTGRLLGCDSDKLVLVGGALLVESLQPSPEPSLVFPLKRGVLLQPIEWDSKGGRVFCVLPCDGGAVDVAGFAVLESEHLALVGRAAAMLSRALVERLRGNSVMGDLVATPSKWWEYAGAAGAVAVACSCFGFEAFFPTSFGAGVGMAVLHQVLYRGQQASQAESILDDWTDRLSESQKGPPVEPAGHTD